MQSILPVVIGIAWPVIWAIQEIMASYGMEEWACTLYSGMLEQGEVVYQQSCANCHGPDGKGVMPGVPDFTNFGWVVSRAPRDLFEVVTEGKGAMPSWQVGLSPAQRWAAIEYLRSFAYEPAAAATTASR